MNEELKLSPGITDEERKELDAKCIEFAEKYNVSKVYCYCYVDKQKDNQRVIAFIKEPDFINQLALMDAAFANGQFNAGEQLRMLYLIKEESHPLTYGEGPECNKYKLGIAAFCRGTFEMAQDDLKKN